MFEFLMFFEKFPTFHLSVIVHFERWRNKASSGIEMIKRIVQWSYLHPKHFLQV